LYTGSLSAVAAPMAMAAVLLVTSLAHGAGDNDAGDTLNIEVAGRCAQRHAGGAVFWSLYQPGHDQKAKYCNNVPEAGLTVIVIDLSGDHLRKTPSRITVADITDGDAKPNMLLELPFKSRPQGIISGTVDLPRKGAYAITLSFEGGRQDDLSHTITLGGTPDKANPTATAHSHTPAQGGEGEYPGSSNPIIWALGAMLYTILPIAILFGLYRGWKLWRNQT